VVSDHLGVPQMGATVLSSIGTTETSESRPTSAAVRVRGSPEMYSIRVTLATFLPAFAETSRSSLAPMIHVN
jgi:hypothetical protein